MEISKSRPVSNTVMFSSIFFSVAVCFEALIHVEIELHAHRQMLQALNQQRQENVTHVQYTQTDTNGQNTLTNRTIGKRLRFVKDALRFVPLERMVSSSVDRNSIGEMHLISTCKPCENEWSIGTIGTNGKLVSRFVPLEQMVSSSVDRYTICKLHLIN